MISIYRNCVAFPPIGYISICTFDLIYIKAFELKTKNISEPQ